MGAQTTPTPARGAGPSSSEPIASVPGAARPPGRRRRTAKLPRPIRGPARAPVPRPTPPPTELDTPEASGRLHEVEGLAWSGQIESPSYARSPAPPAGGYGDRLRMGTVLAARCFNALFAGLRGPSRAAVGPRRHQRRPTHWPPPQGARARDHLVAGTHRGALDAPRLRPRLRGRTRRALDRCERRPPRPAPSDSAHQHPRRPEVVGSRLHPSRSAICTRPGISARVLAGSRPLVDRCILR